VVEKKESKLPLSDAAMADREWERLCGDLSRLASEWLWEMDADLRISYLSDRLRWIMDVDPAYFIGKRREDYVNPLTDGAELEAHLADLRAHKPVRGFIYDVETPSGRRYVKIDGDPLFDDEGNFRGYRGVGTQVTGQIKAQQKAEASFRQLVDAVENLPVGVTQYDANDRLVFWNSAYMRLYPDLVPLVEIGISFEQVLRGLAEGGTIPVAIGRIDEWVAETLAARRKGRAPFEILLSDGRWILVSDHQISGGDTVMVHSDITVLKKREWELAETAQYLEAATRIANLGTWDWDPETNVLRNAEHTIKMCGLEPEHAAVDNGFLMDMIHPDDRERVLRVMHEAIETGEAYTNDYRITRPDGEVRIFHERGERFVDEFTGKRSLHGTIQDVTELRRHEEELRQSERLFQLAFEQGPGMTAISEIETGRHVAVNDRWVEIMGWPREEAIGKTAFELGVWVDPETRARAIALLHEFGRFKDFEGQYRTRRGEVRDFLISAERIEINSRPHMLISGHDITERKRAERELRASEARLSGILRISPEAVIVTDGSQRITLFNEGAERIFGYTPADVLGEPIDILIPSAFRDIHREHIEKFRKSPETSRVMNARQEIRALAKDGTTFPAEASISKLEIHGDTVFTVLLHDITERKRVQQLLLAAKDEAESASRAKSEFLANMSHELRTPLNAILGFSEVIRSQVLGPVGVGKYTEYADDIHQSGEHLLEIISDILDVARIDAGQTGLAEETVTVEELIESSLLLIRERAEAAKLEVTVDFPPDFPPIFCDRRKIKQVIINLLSNAVKFTESGGGISVKAWIDETSGDAIIQISDSGIGMAAEDIPRVLEPFTQIASPMTRQHEGTGLGLPLVKKLTELHSGSIDMETELGKGTAVRVRLPASRVMKEGSQGSLFIRIE